MSTVYSSIKCRTALSPSVLPGLDYSLNPYLGCEHGCIYCYSPSTLRDEWMGLNWGKFVRPKSNIAEVLEREVRHRPRGTVGVSTVCDPYQPIEAKLELTRKCIEILSNHGFPVSIQTKSGLVLRDADLIVPRKFDVGVTITTMNLELAGEIEPRASPPDVRTHILDEFASRGVETWVFLGPIIPEVNDSEDSMRQIAEVARRTKSRLLYDKLNLRRWVLERLAPVIEREKPGLPSRLPSLVGKNSGWWRKTRSTLESICRELGVMCEPAFPTEFYPGSKAVPPPRMIPGGQRPSGHIQG